MLEDNGEKPVKVQKKKNILQIGQKHQVSLKWETFIQMERGINTVC